MLEITEVTEAINGLIAEAYPNDTVYVNLIAKDFARPSTLIELLDVERTDASRNTIAVKAEYAITCFCEVDGHYSSDTQAITERQAKVMGLLARGYIRVSDRSLRVAAASGGTEMTEGYVSLNIEYFDDRPDERDTYPVAESVEAKITDGG